MEAASCRSDHRTRGLLGRTASILSIISQRDRSSRPPEEEADRFRAGSCGAAPCGGARRAVAGSSRRRRALAPSRPVPLRPVLFRPFLSHSIPSCPVPAAPRAMRTPGQGRSRAAKGSHTGGFHPRQGRGLYPRKRSLLFPG